MKKKRDKRDKPIILHDKESGSSFCFYPIGQNLSHGAIHHSKGVWETEYVGSCGQLEVGFHYHGRKQMKGAVSNFGPSRDLGSGQESRRRPSPLWPQHFPLRRVKWAVSSAHTADLQQAGSRAPEDKGDPFPTSTHSDTPPDRKTWL